MSDVERDVVARWWRDFVDSGRAPPGLELVQGRLIRAVHRGPLGEGDVFVKTMTFPRAKDRLRYLLRPLPAAHEAEMLCATAAAGVPCPEVVAAFTARRRGAPHRSMLVLRGLKVVDDEAAPARRVQEEVALAAALLERGIYHADLHTENFVRLASGELAVLDMQSARRFKPGTARASRNRLAVAARMLRQRSGATEQAAVAALLESGVLASEGEVADAMAARSREERHYSRSRVLRCMRTSTEFERRVTWAGVRCWRRAAVEDGRWVPGGSELRDAWIGQRVRDLNGGGPGSFAGYFRKWWWLGGGASLYVSNSCSDDQVNVEVGAAAASARALEDEALARPKRLG
ncbi:MAG: lipopolysaccharide kinase InaA family protein [Planctomycetota bacterium]|nr:lipopolysaccharide kinase InaA family protein [Planctomycetota bacterium]